MTLRTRVIAAVAGITLLAVAGTALSRRHDVQLAVARAAVQAARVDAHHALDRSARTDRAADSLRALADAATRRADSLALVATTDSARAEELRTAYRAVARQVLAAQAVSDSTGISVPCHVVVQRADLALAADSSTESVLRDRAASLQDALQRAATSRDSLLASQRGLMAATGRLDASAAVLVKASRPSLLARLAPHLGLGAAAGVDPFDGRPSATIGVTIGWGL